MGLAQRSDDQRSHVAEKMSAPVLEGALARPKLALVGKTQDPLEELFHRKPLRQHVKEFAQMLAIIGFGVAAYFAWKEYSLADVFGITAAGFLLVVLGYTAPRVLLPVYRGWMKLGYFLEITTTWMILGLMWFGMFVPISFVLRLFGIKVMDMSYKQPVSSYWISVPKEKTDFKLLERQY
jgi:hypothetical protein